MNIQTYCTGEMAQIQIQIICKSHFFWNIQILQYVCSSLTFNKINCANWAFKGMIWARTSKFALKIVVWAVKFSMNAHIFFPKAD